MIHTVILGASTPDAGELIRILAMHPEIELECAYDDSAGSRPLTAIHHGLIGETSLSTSITPDCDRCDIIFDFSEHGLPDILASLLLRFPEARIIRLNRCKTGNVGLQWTYGLPEINRKNLVRGARFADVASPLASMALVALYPLATHMLLNGNISLEFEAPQNFLDPVGIPAVENEIKTALEEAQRSFAGKVSISLRPASSTRSAIMRADIPCGIDLANMLPMYEIYDDHHFAFAVPGVTDPSEVTGTDKCVVSLTKPAADILHIEATADCRMRGGAGEAVHIMNLMCGLHERTGLALKASDFLPQ